jgi:putative spermidine/putrescine transport system ATP-binding protein/spermidine/putrescine transport system ATP-binding protein
MPAERAAAEADGVVALPTCQDIAVRLEGIVKRFGDTVALQDVQLPIRRGELMTLLGPSGCGKTTLLNLVAGFLVPDSGEIAIDGERVTDVPPHERQIGMVFQSYALFPHMDVAANVGYGLRMRRLPRPEIARRVADALALVKLTGLEDRRPKQLSGGQQQRVALARALIVSPKVLLLDEPFSALDKSLRASMQVEINEIQRKLGVTTIFVTHDQSEALSLSDRIAVMSEGRIRQCATPDEVYRRPVDRFVASFVGDVNVLHARLERAEGARAIVALGAARIAVPTATIGTLAAGAPVDLFVRPEQLRPADAGEPVATQGIAAAHVYQGGHVDLYVDAPEVASGRLLMRLPGNDAVARWPIGTRLGIAVSGTDAVAFPRAAG